MIKTAVFAVVVLIVGNWLKIGGKTLSDQVKTQMSQASRISGMKEIPFVSRKSGSKVEIEEITTDESKKLKSLIKGWDENTDAHE